MKKQLFSLVMMIALVIVAGTTMGQTPGTNTKPYPKGTYSYSLGGIKVGTVAGKAVIEYGGSNVSIKNVKVNATLAFATYTGQNITIDAATLSTLTFDITYADNATDGKIKVTVTDGATSACSNYVELNIDVQPIPTIDLAVAATTTIICQKTVTGTLANNKAASDPTADPTATQDLKNTIVFTVTPAVNITTGYSYDYKISLPASITNIPTYSIVKTGSNTGNYTSSTGVVTGATSTTPAEFTITFNTTTGVAPETITATLSDAVLTVTGGSGTYVGSYSINNAVTTINSMPAIGAFTIE